MYVIVKWNRFCKTFLPIGEAAVIVSVLTCSLALPGAEASDAVAGGF
jgi:hypothetical protein